MKTGLIHPLWTHVPAVLVLLAIALTLILSLPLPDYAPVHFDFAGQPDRFGSPWLSIGITLALAIAFIILSAAIDELWAQQETFKTFNWLSLMDEIVVGMLAGIEIPYILMLSSPIKEYPFPWFQLLGIAAVATAFAVAVEIFRPYRPHKIVLDTEDASEVETEVYRYLRSGQAFVYWDQQNPSYVTALTIGLPLVMLVLSFTLMASQPWLAAILFIAGLVFTIFYGGFRTLVTKDKLTVKMGMWGLRLLLLRISDIQAVEPHSFSPLRDFGGYGIRFNREMKAYFLSGSQGVKITTVSGKKYLIGSNHPNRLTAVITALRKNQ